MIFKMDNCIFCKIIRGEVPSTKVYEDDEIIAFNDISPVAPVHVLFVPKKHIPTLLDMTSEDTKVIGHIFEKINEVAKKLGIEENGFRVITNCGKDAVQLVNHIHFHMLAGKHLGPKLVKE